MEMLAKTIRLDEPFEFDGEWRAMNTDWPAIGGKLRFDGLGDLTLTVTGPQHARARCLTDGSPPYAVTGQVAGAGMLGSTATLRGCYSALRQNHGKLVTEKLYVGRAIIGSAAGIAEDLDLSSLRLQFSELDEWAGPGLGYYEFGDETTDDIDGPFQVLFSPPAGDFNATISNASIDLQFSSWWSMARTELQFRSRSEVVVKLEHSLSYDDAIRSFVRPLQDLITLGTGRVNRLTVFGATVVNNDTRGPVQVIDRGMLLESSGSHWLPFRPGLFSAADIAANFTHHIERWLEFYSAYHTVCDLTFSTIYRPARFAESNFLALLQAVEGYHRRAEGFQQQHRSPTEWTAVKKQALDAVAVESRDLVARALQHANDVSLRERIDDVADAVRTMLPDRIEKWCDSSFGKDCAAARNELAHHLKTLPTASPEKIGRMNSVLLWILALTFMREIGLPDDVLARCMKSGPARVERAPGA